MKKKTYKIVRFFQDVKKHNQVIKQGVTLVEAQKHCLDPKTHKPGQWFDGFTEE